MSGGSMDYLYSLLEYKAEFELSSPERVAFKEHLEKVAKALHDIEWVDSGDYGEGAEIEAIRACFSKETVEKLDEYSANYHDKSKIFDSKKVAIGMRVRMVSGK